MITQEQKDRYNANRRLKKQMETPDEREQRLQKRRSYEQRRRLEGGEELRKRTRELALAYVNKKRAVNPNYESERYQKSRLKKEKRALEISKQANDDQLMCPRCLHLKDKKDFPITRSGSKAFVCSKCFRQLTGAYDIQNPRFWAHKANTVLQRAKRRYTNTGVQKITGADLYNLYEKQNKTCKYCGIQLTSLIVAVDHKVPLSRGGSHCLDNIQLVCHNCNISKFTMTDEEYRSFIL